MQVTPPAAVGGGGRPAGVPAVRFDLAWLALWLLSTIGLRPLLLPDEGRYGGVAADMLHGSWLVPALNGLPYFHKPPLLYWLDAAAIGVFGVNPFAARLGPALLAWLLGAALFLHLRRWHGPAVARAGLVVLATSPLFFFGGQYVNHDIGVAACITAAVLCAVRAVDEKPAQRARRRLQGDGRYADVGSRSARGGGRWLMAGSRWRLSGGSRWLSAAWAFCGLAVLAKGLIGIVLPALVVVPWLLAQRRWRQVAALLHPAGLAVFAAVALPWMLAVQARHAGFFDYFIVGQHFRRFAGSTFNNVQPFWFFIAVLPLLMLPWSAWLVAALRPRGARTGLYAWWVLVVVGFFSLPASKLVGYVMPALAPAAALLAPALAARPRAFRALAGVAVLVCVGTVLALVWRSPGSHRDIGLALRERWQPGDRLVYIDDAFFDVRFYAGITAPAIVVSDWTAAEVQAHDNWRKELADAAAFDPAAGRALLWNWQRLAEVACQAGGSVWIVASADRVPLVAAQVAGAQAVLNGRHAVLLHSGGRTCDAAR